MIGIGTRLELPTRGRAGRFGPTGLKSIRIDIDPSEMRRLTPDCRRGRRRAGRHPRVARRGEQGRVQQNQRPPRRDPRRLGGGAAGDSEGSAADGVPEYPARGAAARMPSSPTSCRRSALPPGTAFRSTSRAPSSPRATRARSARAFRPRSAPRSRIPTGRWSRSPATAASCSACRNWRPPCSTRSAWSRWCSTTTPMAMCGATSASASMAAWWRPIWSIRIS